LTHSSLDENISKAVKRYSSLFTLPSHAAIVILLGGLCLLGGALAILPLQPSYSGLALSVTFGGLFLSLTLASDFVISRSSMKGDPVFNLRRCSALSLFSCLIWLGVTFLGSLICAFLESPDLWVKFFFLGFCGALMLRLLVFSTTSFTDLGRMFFSSLLQPVLCTTPVFFMGSVIGYSLDAQLPIFLLVSLLVSVLTVFLFTYFLDRVGERTLGIASSSLFKAFFANWTENLNAPLEAFFEKLGSEQNVRVSLLTFRANGRMKAAVVLPALHPGPFKNVGSSFLPYLIQNTLESKLQCVVSVPHGLVGHELDLSSQFQNQRVVEGILGFIGSLHNYSKATPFVRTRRNEATASCQIFGDCALITLTIAPKSMEDLPQELDSFIVGEAEKLGLSALVIDAHNSIEGPFNVDEAVASFRKASVASLKKALSYERSLFEVGAATVVPKEFTVEEGMGPGGISVIVTRVGDQKAAYVTIDGNNMISGLRERILSQLGEIGFVDGEVLTTDTHTVCGIVRTARGYHPLGEGIDQSKLISYIRQAAVNALDNLEPATASWRTEIIPEVNVIGEKRIEELCLVADRTAKQARKLAMYLFSAASVLLILLLVFLWR
jgi:putative membrane protein